MISFSKLSVLLVSFCLLTSCSKDDSSTDDGSQNGYDYQSLNGTWTGETRILQAGDCPSGDPSWTQVEMEFTVTNNGNVTILVERQFSNLDMMWYTINAQWVGNVTTNDSIFLTKTQLVDCFGTDVTGTTDFASKLLRNGGMIQLSLNALEVFCPDQNCVFDRDYELTI